MNGLHGQRVLLVPRGIRPGYWCALPAAALLSLTHAWATSPESNGTKTPVEKYSTGTRLFKEGKIGEAEAMLESAIGSQQERVQAPALFNLGHVRFSQGIEELKKSPEPRATSERQKSAAQLTDDAIKGADDALQSEDIDKMVAAYLRGKGAKREWKQATEAVRVAMDRYGNALAKWQRSLGDFKGSIELSPPASDAVQNAEIVDRCIAKLV